MALTSPGGWQGYGQNQNQQWVANSQSQNGFGQNGGMMGMSQSQSSPIPPFVGRFIERPDEIMPGEVPMDGKIALFPTKSLEDIYIKAWNQYGQIMTFHYILDPMQGSSYQQETTQDNFQSQILNRLENLEKKLSDNSKPSNQRNKSKGVEENA